jgi:SPP1 family predicted phage head-tail adaptor
MTDPGQFRTKLIYQESTSVLDTVGQPIETWSDAFTVFAKVSPLNARETWWARQTHAETTHMVECRYHTRIKPYGRFKIAGTDRILNIEGVRDVDERRIELSISCIEGDQSIES